MESATCGPSANVGPTRDELNGNQTAPNALYILDPGSIDLIYGEQDRQQLAELANFTAPPQSKESIMQDLSLLADTEVIFSGWGSPVMDEAFLAAAPKLKVVFYGAGAIRQITPPAFWESGVQITSSVHANAVPVAEYCLATILLSLKNFWSLAAGTRKNDGWIPEGAHLREVPGCFRSKVGFISLGPIAKQTLKLLEPFDIERLAYSRSMNDQTARELDVEKSSVDEIFAEADVISLHTASVPATQGMIQGRHFEMMKPGATFINTARGAVVNEAEMIEVLSRRPDITAVLDVTDPEPPEPDSPLTTLPNVVLTPHLAGSAGPECQRLGNFMLKEFQRYLAGKPLRYQVKGH